MANIELYINNKLVNTPVNFTVRVNRLILNPAELQTKDSKFTFAITLPRTPANSVAFDFADVEEVSGKFLREYSARLYVDSVEIINGLFRLTEVSDRGYKGSLYKPAQRTVKDVFGDTVLSQVVPKRIAFTDFAESITAINEDAKKVPQVAIFPFSLYGLLPKVPKDKDANNYTSRNLWDDTVRLGMGDVPPSCNVMLLIRHLFESNGYKISGDAFSDRRLTNLYLSYKNPDDFVQPWNYGHHGTIHVRGHWGSTLNARTGASRVFEKGINQPEQNYYTVDLFDSTNAKIEVLQDNGANVLYKEVRDARGFEWAQTQISIPSSGFYKVTFNTSTRVVESRDWYSWDGDTSIRHVAGKGSKKDNPLYHVALETKLLRDRKTADFGLNKAVLDSNLYYDNQPQNAVFDVDNSPKLFPPVDANGQIVFVDMAQDSKIIVGASYGRLRGSGDRIQNINPLSPDLRCASLCAKPAISWDTREADTPHSKIAIKSKGYKKFGIVGSFGNSGDDPDDDLSLLTGEIIRGKMLNASGNVVNAPQDVVVRVANFYASKNANGAIINDDNFVTMQPIALDDLIAFKVSAKVEASSDLVFIAYYDRNMNFLSSSLYAPASGDAVTYDKHDAIGGAPSGAKFLRVSNDKTNNFIVEVAPKTQDNMIVQRFQLENGFTYKIKVEGANTEAYIHDGDNIEPSKIVQVVGGVSEFNITDISNPRLTMYLKTPAFDGSANPTINKTVNDETGTVLGWEDTKRYAIDLQNAPIPRTTQGTFDGWDVGVKWGGSSQVSAVVWLEAGELISVGQLSTEGEYREGGMHTVTGIVDQEVKFDLKIEPFRTDADWLKVDIFGVGTAPMNWKDESNFDTDSINVYGFLPSNVKVNDFIENVTKALNLQLTSDGDGEYSLKVKQSKAVNSPLFVDLDKKTSIVRRTNTPLGLPSEYKIGFTVNEDEEGFDKEKTDGGGSFATGSLDGGTVEQKSFFSFNWFKDLYHNGQQISVPVVSKSEAWKDTTPYPEAMGKRYTDLGLRMWYFDGMLDGVFEFNKKPIKFARVSNSLDGFNLNYYNRPNTLLTEYFTLLINSAGHYTELTAKLTVDEYEALDGSRYVRFNGDLYLIAQLEGYDPTQRNETKLKLIRIL